MIRYTVFLAAMALTAVAQPQGSSSAGFEKVATQGIDFVYNLEFEHAEEEFQTLISMKPGHPAGHFFLAMVQWWRIMINIDNESLDKGFYGALDAVVDMCDSLLEINPNDVTAIFFKGGAIGFKGRLKFHRNDYLAAANAGRKALPLVRDASALDPNNFDVLLGTGIYNYYAEVIPNEYPFVKPLVLFIPPGDRRKGIEQLTLVSQKGLYASVEATYFLMQIDYYYEKDYAGALQLALRLNARFPNNMLFHRYVGRCYASLNNWEMARTAFEEIAGRTRRGMRGYGPDVEREAEYYLGVVEMAKRAYEGSLTHFYRCDEVSRSLDRDEASGFMVMANLKIGMIYDAQGKRELAVTQYRKVLAMKDYKESHSQAEQFITSPYAR